MRHAPPAAALPETMPATTRVLLIDDDTELCELLAAYLTGEGFAVHTVHDGASGLAALREQSPDIVVLDVMMPRLNGLDVLRELRRDSQVPVIMLTARGDDIDRIVGLELGADDYVPKPCTPRELVARLRAILRRVAPDNARSQSEPLRSGAVELQAEKRIATWNGTPLTLTSTEFNLLEVLLRQCGRVVDKHELCERALGRSLERYDRSIDVHISNLRQKLGALADGRSPIQTVRGVGYLYVVDN